MKGCRVKRCTAPTLPPTSWTIQSERHPGKESGCQPEVDPPKPVAVKSDTGTMISEIQPGLLLAQHPDFANSMKNDIALTCTVLFGKNVPQKLDFEVCGHHQWDSCAVVMEFVDGKVPGVDVHFWRALPRPMLRVYIEGVEH